MQIQYMKTIFIYSLFYIVKCTAPPILCPTFWGQYIFFLLRQPFYKFEREKFYLLAIAVKVNFSG